MGSSQTSLGSLLSGELHCRKWQTKWSLILPQINCLWERHNVLQLTKCKNLVHARKQGSNTVWSPSMNQSDCLVYPVSVSALALSCTDGHSVGADVARHRKAS